MSPLMRFTPLPLRTLIALCVTALVAPLAAQTFNIQGNLASNQIKLANKDLGTCSSSTQGTLIFQNKTSSSGGHLILCAQDAPPSTLYHWYVVSLVDTSNVSLLFGNPATKDLQPGDVVIFGADGDSGVERVSGKARGGIVGVVPPRVEGEAIASGDMRRLALQEDGQQAVAISGLVDVKVQLPAGAGIGVGDVLNVSSRFGAGVKAAEGGARLLGTAVESFAASAAECKGVTGFEQLEWQTDEDCFRLKNGTVLAKVQVALGLDLGYRTSRQKSASQRIDNLERALCLLESDFDFCQ